MTQVESITISGNNNFTILIIFGGKIYNFTITHERKHIYIYIFRHQIQQTNMLKKRMSIV